MFNTTSFSGFLSFPISLPHFLAVVSWDYLTSKPLALEFVWTHTLRNPYDFQFCCEKGKLQTYHCLVNNGPEQNLLLRHFTLKDIAKVLDRPCNNCLSFRPKSEVEHVPSKDAVPTGAAEAGSNFLSARYSPSTQHKP